MSNEEPNSRPDLSIPVQNFQHYSALAFCVIVPVLIALPPRKLDLFTLAQCLGFGVGANRLYQDSRHGFPLFGKLESPLPGSETGLVEGVMNREGLGAQMKYELVQQRLRLENEQQQLAQLGDGEGKKREGVLGKLEGAWMGGETAGWKQRRKEEEKRRIEDGESYGDMIMDQIQEVWGGGRKEEEDEEGSGRGFERQKGLRGAFLISGLATCPPRPFSIRLANSPQP